MLLSATRLVAGCRDMAAGQRASRGAAGRRGSARLSGGTLLLSARARVVAGCRRRHSAAARALEGSARLVDRVDDPAA